MDPDYDYNAPLARVRGESKKSNQALRDYCHMGPGRSLDKLRKAYHETTDYQPPTRSLATLKTWSSERGWQERLARWEHLERLAEAEAWKAKRDDFRERAYELANQGLDKFAEMMQWDLEDLNWNFTSAAKLLAESNKVALLALGEVTEATETRHTGHLINVYANMDDDELNDSLERLMAKLATPGPGTPGPVDDGALQPRQNQGD